MALQPNDSIGPYILIRQLGRGAFGEVWLARHHHLDEERAVKVPTDAGYVRQLRTEAQIQFRLNHPNIVRTLDLMPIHDPPYYVMEYVAGMNLRQKLRAAGKLSLAEARPILRQILLALEHAHAAGICHRDLKPENILCQTDGIVKVTDFGFGKVQAALAQSMIFSGSLARAGDGTIAGTVQYMSPQQQAGEDADPKDDLYAVGVIACELLTGSRPQPMGVTKMLERAVGDVAFATVLEKAMEQDRKDRYSYAAEMRDALDSFGAHTAVRNQSELSPRPTILTLLPLPVPTSAVPPVVRPATPRAGPPRLESQRNAERSRIRDAWVNIIGMKFACIPPGKFLMGSPVDENERSENEIQHCVKLTKPLMMAMTTVTQLHWKMVMGENPSHSRGDDPSREKVSWYDLRTDQDLDRYNQDDLPVENVSWHDAVAFCEKLSKQDGKKYHLPTEAQWEYACRAGTATAYNTGEGEAALKEAGWYRGNSGATIHPVAQKKPNRWGLYDMHGNVWEWCSDYEGRYPAGETIDPTGPAQGRSRVLRGGAWDIIPNGCRCAQRYGSLPIHRYSYVGFRICSDV